MSTTAERQSRRARALAEREESPAPSVFPTSGTFNLLADLAEREESPAPSVADLVATGSQVEPDDAADDEEQLAPSIFGRTVNGRPMEHPHLAEIIDREHDAERREEKRRKLAAQDAAEAERLAAEERDQPPPAPPNAVDLAFQVEEEKARQAREEAERVRRGVLDQYRPLVRRLTDLDASEASELVALAQELGYDRSRIDLDAGLLKEVEQLRTTAAGRQAAIEEVERANAALKALELRVKAELVDAKKRVGEAWNRLESASNAPSRITEIRARRPELFGE
ncbi:MAG: hypothetical protein NTY19_04785 [Planctomycetota bacterium]|nr:hypothetical protein [Planctomycetota bacterium]